MTAEIGRLPGDRTKPKEDSMPLRRRATGQFRSAPRLFMSVCRLQEVLP